MADTLDHLDTEQLQRVYHVLRCCQGVNSRADQRRQDMMILIRTTIDGRAAADGATDDDKARVGHIRRIRVAQHRQGWGVEGTQYLALCETQLRAASLENCDLAELSRIEQLSDDLCVGRRTMSEVRAVVQVAQQAAAARS